MYKQEGNWEQTSLPCPCGKSSDAFAIQTGGKEGVCFSCKKRYYDLKDDYMETVEKKPVLQKPVGAETFEYYPHRSISQKAFSFYDCPTKLIDGKPWEVVFTNPNGSKLIRNVNQKSKMRVEGSLKGSGLFGQDKFDPGGKVLTIVEGQYDALATWDMIQTPVVTPGSSSSALKVCKENWDYINSFDKIVLCFDNDGPGHEANEAVAGLFDFDKVYVVNMTLYKDPNDYLEGKHAQEFIESWKKAVKFTPDNVINTFDDVAASLKEPGNEKIGTWPFRALQEMLFGFYASDVVILKGLEGIGKQLANTTPIPTPTGWTTMGELKVGDYIFGADGKKTKVTFVTEDQYVDCYEVKFNDGTSVVAGGPHKWGVLTQNNVYKVRTTEEILKEGVLCKNNASRYSVPIMKPMEGEEKELLIDPYLLGYWLGDGHSYSADVCIGKKDWKENNWPNTTFEREDKTCMTVRFEGLEYKDLVKLKVLKNKHIPKDYLRASIKQRTELLKGLMDSDGGVHQGSCEFYTSSETLKDDFVELARSLGYACRVRQKQSKLYGVKKKIAYTVRFMAEDGYEVFTLQRKADKVKTKEVTRLTKKAIISIKPVDTVPSRCITVDNPDHLYVCDKGWTVTHNTEVLRAIEHHILKTEPDSKMLLLHLEENRQTTIKGIANYEDKEPYLHQDRSYDDKDILDAYKRAVNNDENRLFIYDNFDVEDERKLFDNIRYLVTTAGVRFIFLDHITWLATGMEQDDERRRLDRISQRLKLLAKELKCCLVIISHVNDDGKTRGSRNISKVANTVIHLERDITAMADPQRLSTHFTIEKSRGGGTKEGKAGFAMYNTDTLCLEDQEHYV